MKTTIKLLILSIVLTLASCGKRAENKLVGTWIMEDNYLHNVIGSPDWTFNDAGKVNLNGGNYSYYVKGNSLFLNTQEWDYDFKLVKRMKVNPKNNKDIWYIFKKQ